MSFNEVYEESSEPAVILQSVITGVYKVMQHSIILASFFQTPDFLFTLLIGVNMCSTLVLGSCTAGQVLTYLTFQVRFSIFF